MLRSATALQRLGRASQNNTPQLYTCVVSSPYSTEHQPPSESTPPRSGGKAKSRIVLALLGTTAVTAATLAYAKSNQDVRDILKDYVPVSDDIIAIVYGERETPVSKAITYVGGFFGGDSKPTPPPIELKPLKPHPPVTPSLPSAPVPKKASDAPKSIQESKQAPKPEPAVIKPHRETELVSQESMSEMKAATGLTISAYQNAIDTLKTYTKKVDSVIQNSTDDINQQDIEGLRTVATQLQQAEKNIDEAIKKFDGALGGNRSAFAEQMRLEVKVVKDEYEKANSAASLSRRYWSQIEQARKYFLDELQAIYPDADIASQRLDLKGADVDALLLLALRRVILYQQMLANQDLILNKRIDAALSGTDEDLIQAKIDIALDKERRDGSLQQQKKLVMAESRANEVLKKELKKQLDVHVAHLNDLLDKREREVTQREKLTAEEKAEMQRANHELRLSAVLGRLKGVDDALKARSDADKMARQSQKLWAACESLESVLKKDTHNPIPLSKQLDVIASVAADSDELVTAVLQSVSSVVRERGVFSEVALREKYNNVEDTCRRLALVPEEGAGLPVYFLSWLQSVFLIKGGEISKDELEDKPTDFSKLDTYEILHRIRYSVERCNWTQALKYSQLLNGAPKKVVRDWAEEVMLHLEARQAAKVLLAHASASGLLYS